MNTAYLATVFSGFLLGAPAPKADAPKTDLEKLQGTWTTISCHSDGKPVPELIGKKMKVIGDKMADVGGEDKKTTVKLDSSKSPREIDFMLDGKKSETDPRGIYEIDGDNLKIGFGSNVETIEAKDENSGKVVKTYRIKRPTSFDDKAATIIVLKRSVEAKDNEKQK